MSSRIIAIRRGKNGETQNLSLTRGLDPAIVTLLQGTLKPTMNSSHRHQILCDPSNVQQFACLFGNTVGFLSRPTLVIDGDDDVVVTGSFTDTLGEPHPVSVPLDDFQGHFTTLVRRADAELYGLAVHPTEPDTVGPPPPRRVRGEGDLPEGSMERLNFPTVEAPAEGDHPVIASLPLFLPVGPGQSFTHGSRLDIATGLPTFPLFTVWVNGLIYAQTNNESRSVTLGGNLFHLPTLEVPEGAPDPFDGFTIRPRLFDAPVLLAPSEALFSTARLQYLTWSDTVWCDLGSAMEPEEPTGMIAGGNSFTPDHFRAVIEPLVNKEKVFGSSVRTSARFRLLLASSPSSVGGATDQAVLPELLPEFAAYLSKSSSAIAADDLKELVKSRLTLANASSVCLDKDATLEPENVTLALSNLVRTFGFLSEKLVSTSYIGAQSSLNLIHFLTPEREALALVAESDREATTLLMSNSTSSTAQLDASRASKLYCSGRLTTFRSTYEAFCNLRVLLSAIVGDLERPMVVTKMLEYVQLLVDRQGRLFFESYKNVPHLAVHTWQDLQSILSAFVRVASDSTLYNAVVKGESVGIANYQSSLDVADGLVSDLRAIINGNGLGKFEGTPSCSAWFSTGTVARTGRPSPTEPPSLPATSPKRQKTNDVDDIEKRKGNGVLIFDPAAAGTNRLPTINVYSKKRGAKTQERICMKFLTRGQSCNSPTCKFPHISNAMNLPAGERAKFVTFVRTQPGLTWVPGKEPTGTT